MRVGAKLSGIAFLAPPYPWSTEVNAGFIVLFGSNHTPVLTDEEWKTIPLKRCDQKDHVMKESDVWQWPSHVPTAGLSGS